MGWASANHIFDRTAEALIATEAAEHIVRDTLAALIAELREGDWDTLDESIERFGNEPAVLVAFRQGAPEWFEDDE